jgi:hypothetical protein
LGEVLIGEIRRLANSLEYEITLHARAEMDYDEISREDILRALGSDDNLMIEDYPEDRRGHSHLVLGWDALARPIHVCCAIKSETLIVITAYRPEQNRWDSGWSHRK